MHNIEYVELKEDCNRKRVYDSIARAAEEDGDGLYYGITWHDNVEPVESYKEALKWIDGRDSSYQNIAIRFYSYDGVEDSKKAKDIFERIEAEKKKLSEYTEKHSVLTFKAEFIGCQKCGSKISKKYMRGNNCPVCGGELRSKTTIDTINGYKNKIAELQKRYEEEKRKNKKKAKIKWLLKYEYHS